MRQRRLIRRLIPVKHRYCWLCNFRQITWANKL